MQRHPEWRLGFADEVWWSRVTQPHLHAWTDDQPLRLVEQAVARPRKDQPADPKALACYGLLSRHYPTPEQRDEALWLRFVDGRPLSTVTTQFLAWCAQQTAAAGQTALLLVWDNASWHGSATVRAWLRGHNQQVKQSGQGARILVCPLPTKSPWLNPIEPKWVHGKRAIVAPARLLTPTELEDRICAYYRCARHPHLTITEHVA